MKKRESNVELLRIIAMFLIVAHHFSVHGNFTTETTSFINNIWLQLLFSGGKIGVNIFILISGFFLINSKKVDINKFIKLFFQLLFYSVTIFTVFVLFKIEPFSFKTLVKHILGYPAWWFAKAYLILYLFHPYINRLLNSLNKAEYKKLLLFSTIFLSLIPTITTVFADDGFIIWFVYLYSLGAYMSKYSTVFDLKVSKCLLITVLLYFFTFSSVIVFDFLGIKFSFFTEHATYLFGINKLTTLLISLFLFLTFKNMKIKYSKVINIIGSATFGIYLIHDSEYARTFLWHTIFKTVSYSNTYILIPYSLLVILIVFVGCLIIELLRIYLVEKKSLKFINMISTFIDKTISKALSSSFFNRI